MAELDAPAAPPLNTMAMELRVGRKYRLGKKIGSGSFGGECAAMEAPSPRSCAAERARALARARARAGPPPAPRRAPLPNLAPQPAASVR
jgi:hypothetical protein